MFRSREIFIFTGKTPSTHLKYLLETVFNKKSNIVQDWVDDSGRLCVAQARCCRWPRGALSDGHCSTTSRILGGQREADGGGCRLGVLTGPKGTPGFSYTASVKRSTFCVLWRQPLQTCCLYGKPVSKFTQHFQSVYVLVLVIIYSINTVIE